MARIVVVVAVILFAVGLLLLAVAKWIEPETIEVPDELRLANKWGRFDESLDVQSPDPGEQPTKKAPTSVETGQPEATTRQSPSTQDPEWARLPRSTYDIRGFFAKAQVNKSETELFFRNIYLNPTDRFIPKGKRVLLKGYLQDIHRRIALFQSRKHEFEFRQWMFAVISGQAQAVDLARALTPGEKDRIRKKAQTMLDLIARKDKTQLKSTAADRLRDAIKRPEKYPQMATVRPPGHALFGFNGKNYLIDTRNLPDAKTVEELEQYLMDNYRGLLRNWFMSAGASPTSTLMPKARTRRE